MSKRFLNLFIALFCVALLAGCNEEAKLQKATPKEADALARGFISALNTKNTDVAEKLIEPTIRTEAKTKLKNLVDLLSVAKPEQVKVIGVRGQQKGEQKLIQLNYQIYFEKSWVVASLAIVETPKTRYIFSVRMDPLKAPLEKLYAFTLWGKSFYHYLTLLFSVLIPAFILYVLVQCVKKGPAKIKWIWVPFIVLGFVSFHLDWATGRAFLQPISFLIFGVSFMKQKFGPLILSVSLPIGALVYFFIYLFKKPKSAAVVSI